MFTQTAPRLLIQRLHFVSDFAPRDNAEMLCHAERKALGGAGQRLVILQCQQRLEGRRDLAVDEVLQAALHLGGHVRPGLVIDERHHTRLHRIVTRRQFANGLIAPHQATLLGEIHLCVRRIVKAVGAQMEMRHQRLRTGLSQRFRLVGAARLVHAEPESLQTADEFALDRHFALVVHVSQEALLLLEPAQQYRCTPVHKSLRQCTV